MNFRAEFFPKSFTDKIEHHHNLLLVGSCFTEQIGSKLLANKLNVLQNPNGILFNPLSIASAIGSYAAGAEYDESNLFCQNEVWGSWQHHTRFSGMSKPEVLEGIKKSQASASDFIRKTDWILLTLGSAFVYEREEAGGRMVVANCHKVPTDKFHRRLTAVNEVRDRLTTMMELVHAVNPGARFIYTISPVRHLREGFIENNLSKAVLVQAVHGLTNNENIFYFPAYELVLDDLRDYRFYAEDLVHPNYAATNYVWEKFIDTAVSENARDLMKELSAVIAARNHRPFNPSSAQHKEFLKKNAMKAKDLMTRFPHLNLNDELTFFEEEGK